MPNPSYFTQIIFDAARCLFLAGVVTAAGWKIGGRLPRELGWRGWALIVAPLCTPALLVSYTYASPSLWLTGSPWLLALSYSILVGLKLTPLGVIARRMFPPSISAEARFCEALIPNRSFASRMAFKLRAMGPVPWMAGGLAFLLAFTDFELASLLSIKTWTVQLFDAHAGGLALAESLNRVGIPLCIEIAVIVALALLARRATPDNGPSPASSVASSWALPTVIAIAAITSGWPIIKVAWHAIPGWNTIGVREAAGEEVLTSLATALVATLATWFTLAIVTRQRTRLLLAVPGMLGALVLSLVILAVLHARPPAFPQIPWRLAAGRP